MVSFLILGLILAGVALILIVGGGEAIRRHDLPSPEEMDKKRFQENGR
jgi:hypothetical protein